MHKNPVFLPILALSMMSKTMQALKWMANSL
jgi:hypothetical protein